MDVPSLELLARRQRADTIEQMLPPKSRTPIRQALIALGSSAVVLTAGGCTAISGTPQALTPSQAPDSQAAQSDPVDQVEATLLTVVPDSVTLNTSDTSHAELVSATKAAAEQMNGLTVMQGQVMLLTLAEWMTGNNPYPGDGYGVYGFPADRIFDGSLPGISSIEDALDLSKSSMAVAMMFNEAGFCEKGDLENLARLVGTDESILQSETTRVVAEFEALEGTVVTPTDLQAPSADCAFSIV